MENEAQELQRIAYTDKLTGLYNRQYSKLNVRGMIQSLKAGNEPLCLLMIDIDKFKEVNDTYGHLEGDEVLKGFASILKELSGKDAIPIRYGGDEFCVVIPGHDKRTGKDLGEKLVKLMEQTPLSVFEDKKVTVSISVGVASIPKDALTYEDLFRRADEALYKAKELGRTQAFVFPDDGRMIAPDLVNSLFPIKKLIGREEETKILLDYLNGRSKIVPVISGSFGMGKTFLMNWVEDKARQASMQVIYVSGHIFWKFQPLSALFSSIALFRENNAGLFDSILDSIAEEHKETLLVHLNIKNAEQEKAFSPELILESITSFFIRIFEKGKTVLILDDIQKIDEDSIRFFNSFLEQFMENDLYPFIAIEKLPDDLTSVLEFINLMPYLENNIQFMELDPFSEAECDRFITSVLTYNPFPESFQEIIYSNTNGKPLFIQELLKNFLTCRKLVYSINQWELADCSVSDLAISLEHIAENRIKLLDAELQDILSKAAVIGDSFDLSMLSKLSGQDESKLYEVLRKGESGYIIIEGSGQEGDFSFINPHEKQALLNLIDKEEQKKMHENIVAFEYAIHGGDTRRIMGRLMYHLNKGFLFRQASELIRETPTSLIGSRVSPSALARLQKSSFKKIEAKESALSPDVLHKSLTTIRNIKIAINNLRLYPKTNKNIRRSIERVFEDIEYFLTMTEAFSISSTPEMILVNGSEFPSSDLGNLVLEIYTLLNDIGLKGITFIRGLKFDELSNFLELPSQIKGKSSDKWEDLLKENNIEHILPDRKIYVAVGENKIALDGKEKVILDQGEKQTLKADISKELIERYQKKIDELRVYVEIFKSNLDESTVPTEIVLNLTKLLENAHHPEHHLPERGNGLPREWSSREQDKSLSDKGVKKDGLENVKADYATLELSDNDTTNLLLDLSSKNEDLQAFAIARLSLLVDDIARIVFNYLSLKNDPKSNRLAAQIVKKVGSKSSDDFLSYISPGLDDEKLIAILQVADIFNERDLLYKKLEELLLHATDRIVKQIEKVLLNTPLQKSEKLLLDFISIAKKEVKYRLLKTAAILKIKGLTPLINSCLIPPDEWVDSTDEMIVEQAAFTAGELPAPDDETKRLLFNYLKPRRFFDFRKRVPDNVRSAALLSLGKIKPAKLMYYLPELTKDNNQKIAKLASKLLG